MGRDALQGKSIPPWFGKEKGPRQFMNMLLTPWIFIKPSLRSTMQDHWDAHFGTIGSFISPTKKQNFDFFPYSELGGWFSKDCLEIWHSKIRRIPYLRQTSQKSPGLGGSSNTWTNIPGPGITNQPRHPRALTSLFHHRTPGSRSKDRDEVLRPKGSKILDHLLLSHSSCTRPELRWGSVCQLSPWTEQNWVRGQYPCHYT